MTLTDTDRINWLETRSESMILTDYETGEYGIAEYRGNINDRVFTQLTPCEHKTLREALDAAITNNPTTK
jgi:hypothetical protein